MSNDTPHSDTLGDDLIDEEIRRQFESAWKTGNPASIDDLLPEQDSPSYLATLEELIHIELEFAWQRSNASDVIEQAFSPFPQKIEAYLQRFPQLNQPEIVRRLLQQERRVRYQYGDRPPEKEYRDRFPDVNLTFDDVTETGLPKTATESLEFTLPGYQILQFIGRGGMGVVYKARQLQLKRDVAIKMVGGGALASILHFQRFQAEAEAVARLDHPNIVQVYDVGEHEGRPYCVLEYIAGGSLDQTLAGQPQPTRQAAELVRTLAGAMHFVHERGIVHRDLKPANVLLSCRLSVVSCQNEEDSLSKERTKFNRDRHGQEITDNRQLTTDNYVPKITDFGLAKLMDQDSGLTQSGDVLGTPSYMAPEQATSKAGGIGPATDVYALGAILYELLTGRPPFRAGTPLETMRQVTSDDPVRPSALRPKLPVDLETICLKCLAKEPVKRYADAHTLAEDLDSFLNGRPIQARPVGWWERGVKWIRRRPVVASLAALLVVVTILGFAGILWQWRNAEHARGLAERRATDEAKARIAKEQALKKARRHLYFHQIGLAERDWSSGDIAAARRFLADAPKELRNWEWRYADWRCRTPLLDIDTGSYSVAISPDGKILATAWNGNIYLWDSESGKKLRSIECPDPKTRYVYRVLFSPDGKFLVAGTNGRAVPVWEAQTGKLVRQLKEHSGRVHRLAFSPDGKKLACGTGTRDEGHVVLWNFETGVVERVMSGHKTSVDFVAYSPNGKLIASAAWDHQLKIWNAETGDEVRLLLEHVHGIAFSPDSRFLAATCVDSTIKIWEVDTGKMVRRLRGPTDRVGTLAFDGNDRLASAGLDPLIRIWNWRTGRLLHVLRGHTKRVQQVVFDKTKNRLASVGSTLKLWNLDVDQEVQLIARHTDAIALSRDGKWLAAAAHRNNTITIWNTETGGAMRTLPGNKHAVNALTFDANQTFAVARNDGSIELYKTPAGESILRFQRKKIQAMAFSPDGKRLALAEAASKRGHINIALWNRSTKRNEWMKNLSVSKITGLSFEPSGKRIIVHGDNDSAPVRFDFNATTGRRLATKTNVVANSRAVAFSPDHKRLATADKSISIWDRKTGIEISTLSVPSRLIPDVFFTDREKRTWGVFFTDVHFAKGTIAARTCEGSVWLWKSHTPAPIATKKTVVSFDDFAAGPVHADSFAKYGIRTTPAVIGAVAEATLKNIAMPLGRSRYLISNERNRKSTFTLHFDKPIRKFGCTRIGLDTGASLARWRMEGLDKNGNIVPTSGEMEFSKDPLPRTFTIRGDDIHSVRFKTDNHWGDGAFATFTALPIVAFEFERE